MVNGGAVKCLLRNVPSGILWTLFVVGTLDKHIHFYECVECDDDWTMVTTDLP